ncbi:MAG: endolytic transglycosylase MltG [Abditibacteriota bacterium]|nr:endolytic transglycosylase MltG [Abditibacteriota bacterium]MBP5738542.1 endolytic transglycosylase MltG [Abditibacteriota bacterium]
MKEVKSIVFFLIAVVVIGGVIEGILAFGPKSGDNTARTFEVKEGDSAAAVGARLEEKGFIREKNAFTFICKTNKKASAIKPGVYDLRPNMTPGQIAEILASGSTTRVSATFPEGYTVVQIEDVLKRKGLKTEGLRDRSERYDFVAADYPEGYLFPDTYFFDRSAPGSRIRDDMLADFKAKVLDKYGDEIYATANRKLGITDKKEALKAVLTVASLVEREARTEKDRPLVASVIYNRLKKGMRLEIDATVSYVPGKSRGNKARTSYSDLRNGSPYNTYRNKGLPPGPICNPGAKAIEAAVRPAGSDYLFYVARKNGSHVFTRTFDEHKRARKLYQGK